MPCNREFEVGDAVATMTPEGFMRGEVERVLDDGHTIQVHCVDTALSLMQAVHLVHALPKAFVAKFPAQAIYCTTFGYYDEKKEDFVDHILKQFVVTHGTNNLSAKVLATSVMNGRKILIVDLFSLSESLIGAYRKFGVGYDTPVYPMFEDPIFTFTSWMASDNLKNGMEIAVTMCSVSEVYGEKVASCFQIAVNFFLGRKYQARYKWRRAQICSEEMHRKRSGWPRESSSYRRYSHTKRPIQSANCFKESAFLRRRGIHRQVGRNDRHSNARAS